MVSLRIIWKEEAALEAFAGHGVDFLTDPRGMPEHVIAVIRGFGWTEPGARSVAISIRPPDEHYDAADLDEAKEAIEAFVAEGKLSGPGIWLSPSLYVAVNA